MGKRKTRKGTGKVYKRAEKRKLITSNNNNREFFERLAEKYITLYFAVGFNKEDEKLLKLLDELNDRWKNAARAVISSNLGTYNTKEKRAKYLSSFIEFIDKLHKKDNKELESYIVDKSEPVEEVPVKEWFEYPTTHIHKALKSVGIKTSAKTTGALLKYVSSLDEDQLLKFNETLSSI
jgi:hypothetical protein